jgi:hypothetical protein
MGCDTKMDFRGHFCDGVDRVPLTQDGSQWLAFCEEGNAGYVL